MNKWIAAFCTIWAMAFLSPYAEAATTKIVVVDAQEAVAQTKDAKEFLEQVQEELKSDQDKIRDLNDEKTRIEERVERDGEVLSDRERARLQEEYERITSDLKYQIETFQKVTNRRRDELFRRMAPRVRDALDELIEQEAYDLVLPATTVVHFKPAYDITRKLTEKLDENRPQE